MTPLIALTIAALIVVAAFVACAVRVLRAVIRFTVDGYQDDTGFHAGRDVRAVAAKRRKIGLHGDGISARRAAASSGNTNHFSPKSDAI